MQGVYPLSPMQLGMLYQGLLAVDAPERAGYDIEQVQIAIDEALDLPLLSQAWTEVVNRYPALCSRFRWRGVVQPEQETQSHVRVPFESLDWRDADFEQSNANFLTSDRLRGFDFTVAPLMRVTVAELGQSFGQNRYQLYWTFHHILLDGRVYARILHEVFATYAARQQGQLPPPVTAEPTYADYISWFGGLDHTHSLDYFKAMLAGKEAPTPLPFAEPVNRPLPALGYGELHSVVQPELRVALRALAEQHQTTVSIVLQAAWAIMLSRLTGDADALFGVTRSCRYSALGGTAQSMVGLLINTLPVRVPVREQDSVGELLSATRKRWLAQREHDQTPLIDVQAQSEFGSGLPLFESLLMYDNRELNESLCELDAAWQNRQCTLHEQPSVPLTVIASDAQVLELKLLFDRRRFQAQQAARISGYLLNTLDSLCRAALVGDVDVLSVAEREQVVFGWNNTAGRFTEHLLIHQCFEASVDATPNAVAVEVNEQTLTYAALEERANRLANALRQRGAGPGAYVGICLSRGFDLIVAMLGVAKSGAAYVPIDPEYPAERIHFMLDDTKAALVVSESAFASLFNRPMLSLSDVTVMQASSTRPAPVATPGNICYAIYTSGSTGKPKGVILTHHAVINTLEWVSRSFNVQRGDRALFVTSPCFDLSVYDVFGVLGAGATVVVATTESLREPRELVRLISERRITIWDSAPAALQRLAPLFPAQGGTHLRLVMLSGDWIPLTLPDAVRKAFPAAEVISLGGATEAAIWSNWFAIGELDSRWTSIPYGRPIQNAQYYVLDKRRKPVPAGVSGDLYISGVCLAQGYLNRKELTAERFVSNPFRPSERMYMTGDLARYFADGNLEFLGRADFQVKIRGFRVELGEVEAAILDVTGVREALCTAFTDVSNAKALVAYVTTHAGVSIDAAAIKQQLSKTLPDFMLPSRIIMLPAMPLSANGKVDRKALPAPDSLQTDQYEAPRSVVEKRMAAIWQQLLRQERVGANDNFFTLGGDSLLAVSLVLEIEHEFNIQLPLTRVLEYPTLSALAGCVQKGLTSDKGLKHVITLNAMGTRPPLVLFCGVGGYGFFFNGLVEQLGRDQPVYVVHAVGADDVNESVDHSIEELAQIYATQIVSVCPSGPLILGGYSFGAMIAFEVATQFERMGRQVPLVVSFDGPAPGHPQLLPLRQRLVKHVSDWLKLDGPGKRRYLRERMMNMSRRLGRLENDPRLSPENIDPAMAKRLSRVAAGLWRARDRYQSKQRMRSKLLLFKTAIPLEWPGCRTNEVYGWNEYVTQPIDIVTLPGSHLEFFSTQNNVRLAEEIAGRIVAHDAHDSAAQIERKPQTASCDIRAASAFVL
ncbi:MAG: amino acid adenylation domain-containing protein [Steroidobacteraceae bacterium]